MSTSFWNGKKVFLTGHTGFKGSWMTQWLLKLGAEVYGYSLAPNTNPNHYTLLNLSANVNETIGDIRDYKSLDDAMKSFNPDIVFHLAAQPLVKLSYDQPLETFETNVMGTANLMNACRNIPNLGAAVIITTDKCYKNKEWEWPYREQDQLGGFDPYSNSKACAELVVQCFRDSFFNSHSNNNSSIIATARAGNVVGGGDWAKNRLIPDMMRAAESGTVLTIRSPKAVRPWQHVLEPINGYMMLAEKLYNNEVSGQGFNFGPDHTDTVTVLDILKVVKSSMNDRFHYEIDEDPQSHHEAGLLKLDSSKARSLLGWTPQMNLDDTVNKVVEWYSHHVETPNEVQKISERQIDWYQSML